MSNNRTELDKIRDYADMIDKPFSAADVMADVGMSKTTVYDYLNYLLELGFIAKVEVHGNTTFYVREHRKAVTRKKRKAFAKQYFSDGSLKFLYMAAAAVPILSVACTGIA